MELTGLHHVTAITANAPGNLAFYTGVLGLRLVKKTVNQDDVSAYHLFYADAAGSPGSEITFFDWAQIGPHAPGSSDISRIALRVPGEAALAWWSERLAEAGCAPSPIYTRNGRPVFDVTDPEGQRLQVAGSTHSGDGVPWTASGVPAEHAIRGMDAIFLTVRRLAPTARVLTEVLGMEEAGTYTHGADQDSATVTVFAMAGGGPGAELHVEERPGLPRATQGAGGVHHVAFRTPDGDEQARWLERIRGAGIATSDLIDRFYFQSLYFREPNGILFEIATDGPGFATDEGTAHLGERLALPPFLEPYRERIEAGLRPLAPASR
jgi:glyoxalase family protein